MKTLARMAAAAILACGLLASVGQALAAPPAYEVVFASFAPMNSDIFIKKTISFRTIQDSVPAMNGKCQPPKKRMTIRKLDVIMCVY